MTESLALPESILYVEDLAVFCQGPGKGKWINMGGRHLRPRGGYAKEFGYKWHEHPRAHWHLPFLSAGMRLSNGTLTLSPRVMLVSTGAGIQLQDVCIEGLGKPEEDERNACLVIGKGSDILAKAVRMERVGLYLWEGACAQLHSCSFKEGLHALYVWGPSRVTASDCHAQGMQGSGFCISEGATVDLENCTSEGSLSASGVWCGQQCKVTLVNCTLINNAQYGAESNYSGSVLTLQGCTVADNAAGDKDDWDGGTIKETPAAVIVG